jgi:hypothetical protein
MGEPRSYNCADMNRTLRLLCSILVAAPLLSGLLSAQRQSHNEKVPVMDGGAGPCSLELTVIGADGKPAYAATVKVHLAYGFGGIRRLDLEAGTNSDGKVKFTGLPAKVHRPPLEFHASKDEFEGVVAYDPLTECQAKHDLTLEKSKAQEVHKTEVSEWAGWPTLLPQLRLPHTSASLRAGSFAVFKGWEPRHSAQRSFPAAASSTPRAAERL